MKKWRRWPKLTVAGFYVLAMLILGWFIVKEFVLTDRYPLFIDKGENVVFGVSVVIEDPYALLNELQIDNKPTDWATSFLLRSQNPTVQVYLDYISVFDDGSLVENSEICIRSVQLYQNEKFPISYVNPLGQLSNAEEQSPDHSIFRFDKDLCLEKNGTYFLPHLLLGSVSSEAYANFFNAIRIEGYRAFEFFPFEEQNILIDISAQHSGTGMEQPFRPSLEVAISQQGWVGEFNTNNAGLTNLHLSRHSFYRFMLMAFSIIMAILVVFLNNIVDDASSFFEIAFGLLLGLWGTHEILIPGYIESSTAIDIIIYILYILVIGEISIVFIDELLIEWGKYKISICRIVKEGIENERVTVQNTGRIPIDITNWILSDELGHKFKFPFYILRGKSKVEVWTSDKSFPDDVSDHLHWGKRHSVWNDSHDTAYLEDAKGNTIFQLAYSQEETKS
jgi:hypothetical protein